ncbi:GNAT family N-acetyltransferase [Deinococcus arcticus]|uniref:GNAT family N-acetyltransferase n=1 Tax=Deinococcus arcticus TaxID=2136176 RepID=A0A2T3W689_9DEIO|nr:GNAT family N-acetyltransferase [Deinococcus arcticus]PTA67405.1 GNAT family N-acetyltransferase [Deinococcus arcticus]
MSLTVSAVQGPEALALIGELARLRTQVFRDYPYLYDGHPDYEEAYLRRYLAAPDLLLVLAHDGERVVGASSALPLSQEDPGMLAPFQRSGPDPATVLYLGESVVPPDSRGRGLGHAFFDEREAHARRLGLAFTAFCAVVRPDDHPARPAAYRPLNAFWTARGYQERPELTTHLSWPEVGQGGETEHLMRFWVRGG